MWNFSDRELAVGIWLLVFVGLALSVPSVRRSLPGLIMSVLQPKIFAPLVLLAAYVVIVVWSLREVGYWDTSLLKDTVLWFLLAGMVAPFSLVGKGDETDIFGVVVLGNLKVLVLLEFLVAFYTFGLLVELVLVPVITIIAMMDVVAERNPEHAQVSKFLKGLQALFGLAVLWHAGSRAMADYQTFATLQTLRQVVLPVVLSVALVPAGWALVLWAAYDEVFVRLRVGPEKERGYVRKAKMRIVRHLGLRPKNVARFTRSYAWDLTRTTSLKDLETLLQSSREAG